MKMATNLTVDSADNSSRWYITPGISSTYDLQVHNDTDRAVLCRVTLASHPETGSVKPQSLTLQARETRTVAVTFGPDAKLPRDRQAVIMVKDAAGQVLRTISRDLISGASTDATIEMAWKSPIVENERLCGFVLTCAIRSLSGAADEFTPDFAAHPSLRFPSLSPVWLEPGDTAHLELPIRWDRAARDAEGWNHPRAIEAFVAVSQGRRSGRLSWDVVQRAIGDMLDRSDRSPVVERKAAAPAFAPSAHASPNPAPVSAERSAVAGAATGAAAAAGAPKLAAVPDVSKKDVKPARPLEIVPPVVPAAAAATAAVVAESAVQAKPANPPLVAPPTQTSIPAPVTAAPQPAVPASAQPAASTQPQLQPKPVQAQPQPQPQAPPKPVQAPPPQQAQPPQPPHEAPRSVHDIAAELATNFDGYRPAFQLVNGQGSAQRAQRGPGEALATSVSDAPLKIDDLDGSIVGSGLNYARATSLAIQPEKRKVPPAAWLAGVAIAAVLGFALTRPHGPTAQSTPNGTAVPTAAAVAARGPAVTVPAQHARPIHTAAHTAPKPKVAPPSPAAVVQTPAPTTAPAAQSRPAPVAVTAPTHATPARTVVRRPPPVDRTALPQIDFVNATYGRYGRTVRVDWSATAQASADVQLTDARGTLIGERAVGPGRSSVLLGLPRGYHGGVYVQVSVTGYHSERVVQTSSLTPF